MANRLEFRDGIATGRLLDPVMRPRGPLAWVLRRQRPTGTLAREQLLHDLGLEKHPEQLSRRDLLAGGAAATANHQPLVMFRQPQAGRTAFGAARPCAASRFC